MLQNIGPERFSLSTSNKDFPLISAKFIGHPYHFRIVKGPIDKKTNMDGNYLKTNMNGNYLKNNFRQKMA